MRDAGRSCQRGLSRFVEQVTKPGMNPKRIVATGFAILLATHASAQGCHNLNAVTVVGQDLLQQSPLFGRSCVSLCQYRLAKRS